MYRALPVASTVCDEKWRERSYRIHRQKLQKSKTSIDNKAPHMYPHLYQKLKKAQMEEERCSEIERDNRTLVKRMTQIMQRSTIDSRNPVQYKSLNRDHRRRELIRITQENQALLKRIQQKQPVYNHLVWEQEREKNEALCERICHYPYQMAMEPPADDDQDAYEYYADQRTPSAEKKASPKQAAPASATGSTRASEREGKLAVGSQSQASAASASPKSEKSSKADEDEDDERSYSSSKKKAASQSQASRASDATKSEKDDEDDEDDEDKEDEE